MVNDVLTRAPAPVDVPGRLRPEPYVVEFVGPKGAGKTTLARRVAASLAAQDPTAWGAAWGRGPRWAALAARTTVCWTQTRADRVLAEVWPRCPDPERRRLLRRWRRILYLYRRCDLLRGGHMIDEGVLQLMEIMHVEGGVLDADRAWATVRRLGRAPDAAIVLDVPEDVINERRRVRGGGREGPMRPEQRAAHETLKAWLAGATGAVPLVMTLVDPGRRDLDDMAAEVVAVVSEGIHEAPPRPHPPGVPWPWAGQTRKLST
jgi:thymidylate kinase